MIGLDTNVLVRYLTQDDKVQALRAGRLIETRCTREHPGWISRIVLCELVWVLEAAYQYSREQICPALENILRTAEFEIDAPDASWFALAEYRAGKADFSDALLGRLNIQDGCDGTATFDSRAANLNEFFSV